MTFMHKLCSPLTASGGRFLAMVLAVAGLLLNACDSERDSRAGLPPECDPDDGSLILPEGFCAKVVADNLGFVRHIAVDVDGDIYAALRNLHFNLGGILALRDNDGDERMDEIAEFRQGPGENTPGMAIDIRDGWLYFGADDAIYRYRLGPSLLPVAQAEVVVDGFPDQSEHTGKSFAFDDDGSIYVNVGAPSNACQEDNRTPGSPGMDPCPELERHAGIWRFDADRINQTHDDGERYAAGIRNAYALAWSRAADSLYTVQHGRDQLHEFWPDIYSEADGADLPSEKMIRIQPGETYSWPYCYHNPMRGELVLAPEYGGDGERTGRCRDYPEPLIGFPAHYGPNDMLFYEGEQFPEKYHDGAFIAFHGSYNRGDLGQVGYQIVFVPFADGRPSGDWSVFADGFAGIGGFVESPEDAEFRPTGVALGPDGSLYVVDSVQGRIWRIRYMGDELTAAH